MYGHGINAKTSTIVRSCFSRARLALILRPPLLKKIFLLLKITTAILATFDTMIMTIEIEICSRDISFFHLPDF